MEAGKSIFRKIEIDFMKDNRKQNGRYEAEKSKSTRPIFGIHPVIEALRAGKEIEKLYFQSNIGSKLLGEINQKFPNLKVPFQFVPVEKLNHLVKTKNHQGIVAVLSPIVYQNVEDIIPTVFEKGEIPLVLILDKVTDVRNIGAIARSAECTGVHAIVVPAKGSAQINSDAIKTSAGAIFNIPICRSENLRETIQLLKANGLQIISCTEKTEHSIFETNLILPTAIIVGSEEAGISDEYLKLSDILAQIPLMGEIESLNVSVAAGVILYEAIRQRNFSA